MSLQLDECRNILQSIRNPEGSEAFIFYTERFYCLLTTALDSLDTSTKKVAYSTTPVAAMCDPSIRTTWTVFSIFTTPLVCQPIWIARQYTSSLVRFKKERTFYEMSRANDNRGGATLTSLGPVSTISTLGRNKEEQGGSVNEAPTALYNWGKPAWHSRPRVAGPTSMPLDCWLGTVSAILPPRRLGRKRVPFWAVQMGIIGL